MYVFIELRILDLSLKLFNFGLQFFIAGIVITVLISISLAARLLLILFWLLPTVMDHGSIVVAGTQSVGSGFSILSLGQLCLDPVFIPEAKVTVVKHFFIKVNDCDTRHSTTASILYINRHYLVSIQMFFSLDHFA